MFLLARQALGEHRWVLAQPDFIWRVFVAARREILHFLQAERIAECAPVFDHR